MNEKELNVIFDIVPEPKKNKVDLKNNYYKSEIERMIRTFELSTDEKNTIDTLRIKGALNKMSLSFMTN